ncbi:fimbria/pilus outer membrane usher protein [Paraburkholderia bannensis]|uniref:fimbria/pilus outer membrane usher protein n=1 Tax=Paraburkholderia bannensis TaxID=765414 RepID=UPI002AB6B41B|nr:fimbria/pilus outer membrane usher protein [Paraburkholderia bannensis]
MSTLPASSIVPQIETLVLEIIVNGTSQGEPSTFEQRDAKLYARPETLSDAGIRVDNVKAGPDGWIALDAIPDMHYRYDPQRQQVVIDIALRQQVAQQLGYHVIAPPKATSGTGFVLNYDASYVDTWGNGSSSQLGVWSEQRLFSPLGVLSNTGTWLNGAGVNSYTRLDSDYSYSDASKLFTLNVGDSISGSLPWTRAVRFGGIQIQRNFSLQPSLVTFPLPVIAGSAAVPSAVDLYINGLRQYSGNAQPGPFQIAQPPALTGAGVAQVTVTDVLGRRVTTSVPLYVDTRRLSQGLFDYSAEIGFLREGYGTDSFSYNSSPLFSATFRYGLRNWLTLQNHVEVAQSLRNAGMGSIVGLGDAGSLSLAGAGSTTSGASGALYSADYQYIGPRFSLDLQGTRATPGYRDLAAIDGGVLFRHQYQVTGSVTILRAQTLNASYIDAEDSYAGHSRVLTLGYSAQTGSRWSLYANVFKDYARSGVWGGSIGVTVSLGGNASATATVTRNGGQTTANVSASRPADFGGGWGWAVQGGAGSDYHLGFASANYRSTVGDFQATAQRFNGTNTGTLGATGALTVMDGTVLPSRTLGDGFALVSTDGVANVPVLQENRVVGTTNARGYLLVPDMPSYERNQLSIDPLALPADALIETSKEEVAPERRAGVLVRFGLKKYTGASVSFVDDAGQPLPAGAVATAQPAGVSSIVGYDGLAFFERLEAQNTITIEGKGVNCSVKLPFNSASATDMPQLGPIVCHANRATVAQ